MEFRLNGQVRQYNGSPELSLLKYLREVEGLISPKDGCSGQGTCGCCTVHLNGKPTLSCVTKMSKVEGAEVLTTEGLEKRVQEVFQKAFLKEGGIQCGFCTPGIVMAAAALLKKNLSPTRDEVKQAIHANLCRCTGYKKIVDSVLLAAEAIRENREIDLPAEGAVGKRLPKVGCREAVLGWRPFVADMKADGMLHGALKFSDHPRARIVRVDVSEAAKAPGVIRVVTAKDVPGDRVIGLISQDWSLMIAEGEVTHYIGDVIAGVIARTEDEARAAAKLVKVEYEVLDPVIDAFEALKPGAPVVHPQLGKGNVLSECEIKMGDADRALATAAHVVTGVYKTQTIEHAFLEPECCMAKPWQTEDGQAGLEVFSQSQGVYEDRKQISKILGWSQDRVKVVQVQNGGGFGGKEDMTVQGHAALHAFLVGAPVRVALTRDESICMHPKRHPFHMEYTLGCDAKGRLTALKAVLTADSGAYASVGAKVVERAVGHAASAYEVLNLHVRGVGVYTNNIPNGAMRGFGVNQAAFAMEGCIDELCKKGGFDPWQIRYDNAIKKGSTIATQQVLGDGIGVQDCLKALKPVYDRAKSAGRATGLAVGIKNTGIGNGMPDIGRAKIEVLSGGRVRLHHGWTEMGQGVHTMAVQSFCDELEQEFPGLFDPCAVDVKVETDEEVVCGMTTSSRGTSLVGLAVIEACKGLKEDLRKGGSSKLALEQLSGKEYFGEWICDWTTKPGHEDEARAAGKAICTHYSYGYAAQCVVLDEKGRIEKIVAAHDAGRIMNPTLFEGQIEGALHMGLGYAVTEELVLKDGRPVSTRLSKCGILRAKEMPEVEVIGVECRDPHGPFGAKGVGEIGLVPTAGAVANALARFDGVRRYELPLREKKLLR